MNDSQFFWMFFGPMAVGAPLVFLAGYWWDTSKRRIGVLLGIIGGVIYMSGVVYLAVTGQ